MAESRSDTIIRLVFAGIFGLVALLIVALQTLHFLIEGRWLPISLLEFIVIFSDWEWGKAPSSWLGLHKILAWIPASLPFFAFAWFLVVYED